MRASFAADFPPGERNCLWSSGEETRVTCRDPSPLLSSLLSSPSSPPPPPCPFPSLHSPLLPSPLPLLSTRGAGNPTRSATRGLAPGRPPPLPPPKGWSREVRRGAGVGGGGGGGGGGKRVDPRRPAQERYDVSCTGNIPYKETLAASTTATCVRATACPRARAPARPLTLPGMDWHCNGGRGGRSGRATPPAEDSFVSQSRGGGGGRSVFAAGSRRSASRTRSLSKRRPFRACAFRPTLRARGGGGGCTA